MTEQADVQTDNPATDAAAQKDGGSPAAADKDQKQDQRFILDYPTREEAEKGFKELQGYATRLSQERAAMEARVQTLEAQVNKTKEPTPQAEWEQETAKRDKELASRVQAAESPYEEMIRLSRAMALDSMDIMQKRIAELEKKLGEQIELVDPTYQSKKDRVDELMKETGVSRQQALKTLAFLEGKDVKAGGGDKQQRGQVPSKLRGAGNGGGDDDQKEVKVPEGMLANINTLQIPAASKAAIIKSIQEDLTKRARKG